MTTEQEMKIPEISRVNGWQKLNRVQRDMCVSKDNAGANGRYKYYTTADILDEAKKYLTAVGADVIMSDDIEEHQGKIFVTCLARFIDADTGETVEAAKGLAQLDQFPGQNTAQSTGTASTYARKRALAGLLLVETNETDPDALKEERPRGKAPAGAQKPQRNACEELRARLAAEGVDAEDFSKVGYNAPFRDMPQQTAAAILQNFGQYVQGYRELKEAAKEEIPL